MNYQKIIVDKKVIGKGLIEKDVIWKRFNWDYRSIFKRNSEMFRR